MGGQVIDPTANVRELVLAESKYQDAMREASDRFNEAMRIAGERRLEDLAEAERRRQNELRAAEATRLDQLAELRVFYDTRASADLSNRVQTTAESLSNQITTLTKTLTTQIDTQVGALSARVAEVERFKYESGGRTSVTDPATERALMSVTSALQDLQASRQTTEGKGMGQAQVIGWIVGAVTVSSAAVGIIVAVVTKLH
jgi:hypothetical protein